MAREETQVVKQRITNLYIQQHKTVGCYHFIRLIAHNSDSFTTRSDKLTDAERRLQTGCYIVGR